LGIGDWGLGIGDWAQSPIPNPHISNLRILYILKYDNRYLLIIKIMLNVNINLAIITTNV